ncbi:RNA degradosome polyphosphate kinase [Boudabousia tangfeifanii]|uniref:RNA degradosome polyphosphate kinase n=1 Tax=Boudabousia tangfeifanii TaxID=1912795 RepID=UPI000B1604E4|nr:RNA degradosome polyphosphate kinase [Boudabousia tangfeifanii]
MSTEKTDNGENQYAYASARPEEFLTVGKTALASLLIGGPAGNRQAGGASSSASASQESGEADSKQTTDKSLNTEKAEKKSDKTEASKDSKDKKSEEKNREAKSDDKSDGKKNEDKKSEIKSDALDKAKKAGDKGSASPEVVNLEAMDDEDDDEQDDTTLYFEELPTPISEPLIEQSNLGEDQPLPAGRFADRELSWMAFNERVLEQAEDPNLPLLERAWFLAIFSSNLDEFMMVRAAGLKRRIAAGIAKPAASGLSPQQVMDGIRTRTRQLTQRQGEFFQTEILPGLEEAGLRLRTWEQLEEKDQEKLTNYFRKQIFPVLTPLAVDPSHPFPYISGLSLNIAVVTRNPISNKEYFARVKVPDSLPRFLNVETAGTEIDPARLVEDRGGATFVPIESVISAHLAYLFPGMEILEDHVFRLTRNEDVEVEEDDAENLLTAMEQELLRRKFGPAVRLEVTDTITPTVLDFLVQKLEITHADVYRLPEPLDLTCLNQLHDLDLPHLKYPNYVPVTAFGLSKVERSTPGDIFASMRDHDILLHHPYDSFATSVQHFVATAAKDPQVQAIKQTLYRTSSDSPIVSALIAAAQAGKQVVAIVEIKARFDEDANISWARKLERAGVHVVYGMIGLKTHCKLSLVVRQEADGLRRYCHVGTGNYHPKTARGYEDLGLLTTDPEVAQDLTRLFNLMSGYAPLATFNRLLVAPRSIRPGLIERIEREVEHHKAGRPARISIKVNSIVDEAVIDALYRASQAGVKVDIVVRGICAIRSGVPGLSDNIRVRSILGRYLEHSRVYAFENGGDPEVWIGSADLMHRNLDRRIEALVKVKDPDQIAYLKGMVRDQASGKTSSWRLRKNGSWQRRTTNKNGKPLVDYQQKLMSEASARVSGRS